MSAILEAELAKLLPAQLPTIGKAWHVESVRQKASSLSAALREARGLCRAARSSQHQLVGQSARAVRRASEKLLAAGQHGSDASEEFARAIAIFHDEVSQVAATAQELRESAAGEIGWQLQTRALLAAQIPELAWQPLSAEIYFSQYSAAHPELALAFIGFNQCAGELQQLRARWFAVGSRYTAALRGLTAAITHLAPPELPALLRVTATGGKYAVAAIADNIPASHETLSLLSPTDPAHNKLIWAQAALTPAEVEALIRERPDLLANMPGIPTAVNEAAAAMLLLYLRRNPDRWLRRLGLVKKRERESATQQLKQLTKALGGERKLSLKARRALEHATDPSKPNATGSRLLALGRHDGQLVAQVALGDPTTAKDTVMLVPGMGSNVGGAANGMRALAGLRQDIGQELAVHGQGQSAPAAVLWLGYDSPDMVEVFALDRANGSVPNLTAQLQSYQQQNPAGRVHIIGHSYGSTAAAQALQAVDMPVASFFTIGSAGLASGITRQQIKAQRMYAGSADRRQQIPNLQTGAGVRADDVAPIGRLAAAHSVDPRQLAGVQTLPSNSPGGTARAVGTHSLFAEDKYADGYLNRGTQTQRAIVRELSALISEGSVAAGQTPARAGLSTSVLAPPRQSVGSVR